MKKIYITGISGTGKSTIADELNKRNIFAFDLDMVDGLCDWRHKKTLEKPIHAYHSGVEKDWLEAHEFFCDVKKLKKLLSVDKEIVVAVGIASNQNEYLSLFDKIFLLQCDEKCDFVAWNQGNAGDVLAALAERKS